MKTLSFLKSATVIAVSLISFSVFADVDTFADDNAVTLSGHDAVAYFTENQAVEGSAAFTSVYDGAIFYFSSAKNRDTFNANPAKYAPQYGGFCAYGTALGKKLPVDGKAFEVVDGKLYVNKNLDVYETWVEDKEENITEANSQWKVIKSVAAQDL
ncbi:MAG: YHS domain-containing (seleno)protein [Pseudomonadota bacterium]